MILRNSFLLNMGLWVLVASLALFVGFRSPSLGIDTTRYADFFYMIGAGEGSRISEFLFVGIAELVSIFTDSYRVFFVLISFVSLVALMFYYKLVAGADWKDHDGNKWVFVFLSLAATFLSPFFWNAQTNVIRVGVSIPLLLLSTLFIFQRKYMWGGFAGILSVGFHYSSLVYFPFFILLFIKREKLLFAYAVFVASYASGLSEMGVRFVLERLVMLVPNLDLYYLRYLDSVSNYQSGVRYDFLIFTSLFAVLAYIESRRRTTLSLYLFSAYVALSLPFLLIGFIAYSDRLLLPAWFLIPPLLGFILANKLKSDGFTLSFSAIAIFFGLLFGLAMFYYSALF